MKAVRRGLQGDLPAGRELIGVKLESEAHAVKAHHRLKDPAKIIWLAEYTMVIAGLGLFFNNVQTIRTSPVFCVPKHDSFRLVSNYQAVNAQVEESPELMHFYDT